MVESETLLPGIKEYLDYASLKHLKIGLASSSGSQWISSNLKNLGIESFFDSIVTKDDVEKIKPYPDIYLLSIKNMALSDNEIIVFEDSYNGLSAAKAANLFTIIVPNKVTDHLDFEKADIQLNSLADISFSDLIMVIESQSA